MPSASIKYTKLHDRGFWPAYYWGYNCWQKEAYLVAKTLHDQKKFDAAYLLNMTGFREPGYLWKLDIPFIWGPINGFHSIPFSFLSSFRGKEFIIQTIKHLANEIQIRTSARAKKAARKAALVWGVDEKAVKTLTKWKANAELMQETGLNLITKDQIGTRNYDGERCLKLVWSGIMISRKALNILIQALIMVKHINCHLTVLGTGSLQDQLKREAEPIQNKITWAGKLLKDEAIEMVNKSDLLIHTSLSEGTPHSILEAIGLGVPVICHDICGMSAIVNEKNGFKIPYNDFTTSVEFISDLLEKIQSNPDILNERYETIWETTNDLTWDTKVRQIANKIDKILN
jgi:glycosyltransferase involved in cell wall biosynthesis